MVQKTSDGRWIWGWGAVLAAVVIGLPIAFRGTFGGSDKVFVYAGAVVTAIVALIAHTLTRQSNRRLEAEHIDTYKQLRLEAAMRAGALFASSGETGVDPATAASGLLALTRLGQAELAVALLVDLWSEGQHRVSTETAILVIDAALRSEDQPNAQLVAAELLCRNAENLDACQSLHWPSLIDGGWDRHLGPKTKLLLFEALLNMTLATKPNENALRSVAVRLYGMWTGEKDLRVQGCVGTLIKAIIPQMQKLGYSDFIQGNYKITLADLENAAKSASDNPDEFLHRIVARRADQLSAWSAQCDCVDTFRGSMATTAAKPTNFDGLMFSMQMILPPNGDPRFGRASADAKPG
jgi:hypothetical protein